MIYIYIIYIYKFYNLNIYIYIYLLYLSECHAPTILGYVLLIKMVMDGNDLLLDM